MKYPDFNNKKSYTDFLIQLKKYLEYELENPICKFSKEEMDFSRRNGWSLHLKPIGIRRYLPFLSSKSQKTNTKLSKEIHDLFKKKTDVITEFYKHDIEIVNDYIEYAKRKLGKGELFYFKPIYENCLWTKKEFPKNIYNYLSYQIRINPIRIKNFEEDLKGYFSILGLGLNDKEKTKKANLYFTSTVDPFSFKIPEEYNDVSSEIYLSVTVMAENEKLFDRIMNDVKIKFENL